MDKPSVIKTQNKALEINDQSSVSTLSVFVETYICYQLLKDTGYDLTHGYYALRENVPHQYQPALFRLERRINTGCYRVGYYSGLTHLKQSLRHRVPKLSPRPRIFFNAGILGLIAYHHWQEKKRLKEHYNHADLFPFNEQNITIGNTNTANGNKFHK